MTKLFYTTLYGATLAAACAVMARYESAPTWSELLGAHTANAQSPDIGAPWHGDPAATTAINPSFQNAAGMNQMGQPTGPFYERTTSRPEGWPGGAPPRVATRTNDGLPGVSISSVPSTGQHPPQLGPALPGGQPIVATSAVDPVANPAGPPQDRQLEGARILARVGTEYILAADVIGPVNEIITRNADKIPPSRLDEIREQLIRQRLESLIQTKMLVAEVRRKIPEEGFKKFSEKLGQQFDEEEVPKVMVKENASTPQELDARLHQTGSSLDREKRAFIERQLSMGWIHQQIKSDEEVSMDQMLKFYYAHAAEFDNEATARWEQIVVRFDRGRSKADAYRMLAEAGNRIIRGEKFGDVAKQVSEGPSAATGGEHDWTTQGSLVSESIDRALFALPVNQLSPILEDERSFQIIRVLERKDAGRTPFPDAQPDIKKRIKMERMEAEMQKYLADVRKQVKVWTIYDDKPADDLVPLKINAPSITNPGAAPPPDPRQQPVAGMGAPPATQPAPYPRATPSPPPSTPYPTASAPPASSYPTTTAPPAVRYPATNASPTSPYPSTGAPSPYPVTGNSGSNVPAGPGRLR